MRCIYCSLIFAVISSLFSEAICAQTSQQKIPLIISDHHADHLEFFLKFTGRDNRINKTAVMVVLDAHADTVVSENPFLPSLAGNHDWIYPMSFTYVPLEHIALISVINGTPRHDIVSGFFNSLSLWNKKVDGYSLKLDELRRWDILNENTTDKILFVSIDLDFFYSHDHTPQDVPAVLNALFEFTSRWQGAVVWGICLSRPWLPSDNFAWTLLDRAFLWLNDRPEFNAPVVTLFNSQREDTSRLARWHNETGRPFPRLREEEMPENVKSLLQKLTQR